VSAFRFPCLSPSCAPRDNSQGFHLLGPGSLLLSMLRLLGLLCSSYYLWSRRRRRPCPALDIDTPLLPEPRLASCARSFILFLCGFCFIFTSSSLGHGCSADTANSTSQGFETPHRHLHAPIPDRILDNILTYCPGRTQAGNTVFR